MIKDSVQIADNYIRFLQYNCCTRKFESLIKEIAILSASQHLKFVKHQAEAVLPVEVGTLVHWIFPAKTQITSESQSLLFLSIFFTIRFLDSNCTDQNGIDLFFHKLNWVMKKWIYHHRAKPRKHESSQPSSECWIQMTFGCKQIASTLNRWLRYFC